MDSVAIAKAVQAEIERQQTDVVYSDLSVAELEDVIKHLSSRLDLCKQALAEKQGGAAAAPKMVAQKATGSWPELPWTDRAPLPAALPHTVAQGRRTLKLRVPLPLLQLLPASRMRTRSPSTSPSRCANASWSSMVPWAPPSSSTSSPRRTSAVREPSDGPHGQPPGMAAAAAELARVFPQVTSSPTCRRRRSSRATTICSSLRSPTRSVRSTGACASFMVALALALYRPAGQQNRPALGAVATPVYRSAPCCHESRASYAPTVPTRRVPATFAALVAAQALLCLWR